jgi:hypothetical protein
MNASRIIAQPYPVDSPAAIYRQVASYCALAIVLLLLLQPLLCLISCAVVTHTATHDTAHTSAHDYFLCHMSEPASSRSLLIPAFWPGVLPVLVLLAGSRSLLLRLPLTAPQQLIVYRYAPPQPPPRRPYAA